MRAFLIALMIALLPLRGWVGEAMAFSMLTPPATNRDSAHIDCPGHADTASTTQAGDQTDDPMATQDGTMAHSHSACDICNGPLMVPPLANVGTTRPPQPWFTATAERFASCPPGRDIKPPIA